MYLSQRFMNSLNTGQRQAMNFLSYVDAYSNGETDTTTSIGAITNELRTINRSTNNGRVETLSNFDELFELHDDGLHIHVDKTKELCQLLRLQNI